MLEVKAVVLTSLLYHLIAFPVATKFATVAELQKVWAIAVGVGVDGPPK